MKLKAVIIILFLFTGASYSQDKNEHAEQEMDRRQKERAQMEVEMISELEAKKAIFSFFYDTKAEVRKLSMAFSPLEWEQIINVQQGIWNNSVRQVLEDYSTIPNGYSRFLRDQYEMLLKYEDAIMDISYSAMHHDLSAEKFSSISDDAVSGVNSVAQRDF